MVNGTLAAPPIQQPAVVVPQKPAGDQTHASVSDQIALPSRLNGSPKKETQVVSRKDIEKVEVSKVVTGNKINIQIKRKHGITKKSDFEETSITPKFDLPPKPSNASIPDSTGTRSEKNRPSFHNNGSGGVARVSGPPRPKMTIPDSEFDFESSNAKFDKSSVLQENSPSTQTSYQKSSFFDNISCEVKDRMENTA
jgi:protein LSM14